MHYMLYYITRIKFNQQLLFYNNNEKQFENNRIICTIVEKNKYIK
ncbi:hypothetical protein UT300016_03160 [Clostridium senegalense]